MQCLRHAVRPKDYLKEVYPEIEHDWPAYGLPELLITDNGKEFRSRHLDDACLQLGIRLEHAPPKCPWYKGTMERWFGTQNTRLLHELPGTTFSDIFDRGDYDPQKHAVISFEALLEITHTWVVDLYHHQVQSGIRDLPDRRWRAGIDDWAPNLPRCADDLNVLIGCIERRRIGNSGVELFTLHYNSPELALIRRRLKGEEKAQIKYDPSDLSMIHVLDPDRERYLPVPALEEDYARRLTLWQHKIIRSYARRFVNRHLDPAALCRARERIEQIVAHERVVQKRLAGRQKVARFLDIGQPDYDRMLRGMQEAAQGDMASTKGREERILKLFHPPASADFQPNRPIQMEPAGPPAPISITDPAPEQTIATDEAGWGIEYSLFQPEGGSR
jgi:putative transposase